VDCWWIKRAAIVLKFLLKNGQKKSGRRVDLSPVYPTTYHLIKPKSSQSSKQKSHSLCTLAAYFLSLHIGNGTHALQLIACARMQNGDEKGENPLK